MLILYKGSETTRLKKKIQTSKKLLAQLFTENLANIFQESFCLNKQFLQKCFADLHKVCEKPRFKKKHNHITKTPDSNGRKKF